MKNSSDIFLKCPSNSECLIEQKLEKISVVHFRNKKL